MDLYLSFVMRLQVLRSWNNMWEEKTKKSVYKWVTSSFRKQHPDGKSAVFFFIDQGLAILPPGPLEVWNDCCSCSSWHFLTSHLSQLGHFRTSGAPLTGGGVPQGAAFGPISFLLNWLLLFCLNEMFLTQITCVPKQLTRAVTAPYFVKRRAHLCIPVMLHMYVLATASWKNQMNVFFPLNSLTDCSCNGAITSL